MFKSMLMKQVDLHYNCEQKKILGGYFQISHICSKFLIFITTFYFQKYNYNQIVQLTIFSALLPA